MSPAAEIIADQKRVFSTDLRLSENLFTNIDIVNQQKSGDRIENQKILNSMGATWEGVTNNYQMVYHEALKNFP
jgi:hypothetical protein